MTIYEKLIKSAENGKSVSVDFNTKSVKVNGRYLVKDGKFDGEYGISVDNAKETVEQLFDNYCYSYPSQRGVKKKSYFLANEFEELTNEQLARNEDRVVAQVKLEAYVLGLILYKCSFNTFDTNQKHWFWQSQKNKKLVVHRQWFQGE